MFNVVELIRKKRDGSPLHADELKFLIDGYVNGTTTDYQMSAYLMAVCLRGMNQVEKLTFTDLMLKSGKILSWPAELKPVDKHSTGGVGDKTSLILAPLVASFGIPVPMIAGRGLGHTGGTLDKLESITGFNVSLSLSDFQKQVQNIGCAIIGQTAEICPADKKLYALRDVTGTIDSIPLICGSIMSKKLAEGLAGLILDVKYGSGAFMKGYAQARDLALQLAEIGQNSGMKVRALLTSMNQPLGPFAGNSLEIEECRRILKGEEVRGTYELTVELAAHMIFVGGKSENVFEARKMAMDNLSNGKAWDYFVKMCSTQGANAEQKFEAAPYIKTVEVEEHGYLSSVDVESIGWTLVDLGAGRRILTDKIDHRVGMETHVSIGDEVQKGQPLVTIHARDEATYLTAARKLKKAFVISHEKAHADTLISEVIT